MSTPERGGEVAVDAVGEVIPDDVRKDNPREEPRGARVTEEARSPSEDREEVVRDVEALGRRLRVLRPEGRGLCPRLSTEVRSLPRRGLTWVRFSMPLATKG